MYQGIFFEAEKRKLHIWDDQRGYFTAPYRRYGYIKDRNGAYTSLYGDRLKKIHKWDKTTTGLFESDVHPETRTLIDLYTNDDEPSKGHRTIIIDIEVEVTDGFPTATLAENKVTAISIYDFVADKYHALVLENGKGIVKPSVTKEINTEVFDTEVYLLNRFFQIYLEINPSIITGWNVDRFDVTYLYNRACNVLDEDVANCLSPIGHVHWSDFRGVYRIAGVATLDYLQLYKKFTFTQQASYRLDAIADFELGERKIEYDGTLNELYENDILKFVEYNIHDVRLIKMMDDKLNFIEIARGICHKGHVPYDDIYLDSRYLESAILVHLKKLGVISPNKPEREGWKEGIQFEGAHVQKPKKGRHAWVYDLDLTSMYPSIIMSLNISPETKMGKIDGWDAPDFVKKKPKTYTVKYGKSAAQSLDQDELQAFFDEKGVSISANGIMYSTDRDGLFSTILKRWFEERVEYRGLAKKYADAGDNEKYSYFNRRQHIQKILLNSLFGVIGLQGWRFHDFESALAVTATGRDLIGFSKQIANHYYNTELGTDKDYVIYIDTDSLFISSIPMVKGRYGDKKFSDVMLSQYILTVADDTQKFINKSYDYFAKRFCNISGEHRFEIKQELIAKSAIFVNAKKNYGLRVINDNGVKVDKTVYKGLAVVRSDFPQSYRKLLGEVLSDILADVPKEKIDERIIEYKNNMKYLKVEDVAKPTGVKNIKKYLVTHKDGFSTWRTGCPIHVKSSIIYNDLVKHFNQQKKYQLIGAGDKVKWVYLKKNNLGLNSVAYKGHEDPKEIMDFIYEYVDRDKMYDSIFLNKIVSIYDAIDWQQPIDKKFSMDRFF